ncbi:MAG: hypothetical protein U9R39_08685 [Campylobacterota bacterium]|nr:hypothetical protein [Campylobacterota bacterium]
MYKKIIAILLITTSAYAVNCSSSYGMSYGEKSYCKSTAQGAGEGSGLVYLMEATGRSKKAFPSLSNDKIYDICHKALKKDKRFYGSSYENIFMSGCAKKLGYRFR